MFFTASDKNGAYPYKIRGLAIFLRRIFASKKRQKNAPEKISERGFRQRRILFCFSRENNGGKPNEI